MSGRRHDAENSLAGMAVSTSRSPTAARRNWATPCAATAAVPCPTTTISRTPPSEMRLRTSVGNDDVGRPTCTPAAPWRSRPRSVLRNDEGASWISLCR